MTKHSFPAYAFHKQKRYLHRHLAKPRSMKLHSFIRRLQELNANLEEFRSDTEGQETVPLPAHEIMDIIYNSMRNFFEQGFNYVDSTIKEMIASFETRVENLEPKEDRKRIQLLPRNPRDPRNPTRKGKEKTTTPV